MNIQGRRLIGTTISVVVLFLGLSAFSAEERPTARGKELFRDHCAKCHGLEARGKGMVPSLIGVTERMSTKAIAAHARMIGERMCCAASIKKLSDENFSDIVEYLETLHE